MVSVAHRSCSACGASSERLCLQEHGDTSRRARGRSRSCCTGTEPPAGGGARLCSLIDICQKIKIFPLVLCSAACKILQHELGDLHEWASSSLIVRLVQRARGFFWCMKMTVVSVFTNQITYFSRNWNIRRPET